MIIIDYRDRRPIYEQIVERFKELILKGILEPESQLPSVRTLAMDLSINPNTIQKAYSELERQGFLYSVKGKGSFVSFSNDLLQEKRAEIIRNLDIMFQEAKRMGISEEKLLKAVKKNYTGGIDND